MWNAVIHDQREIRSGAIGASATRGVRCYVSLPAHGERGVERGSPDLLDAYYPQSPGNSSRRAQLSRGFGLGSFSHSIARLSLNSAEHTRRAGTDPLRYRLVAPNSLRVLGRSRQFRRIGYQPGSYVSDPCEGHSFSPFHGVTFQYSEHVMEGVGSAQDRIGEYQDDRDDC
jgi:hypothetical protein